MNRKTFDPKDVRTPIQLVAAVLLFALAFAGLFVVGANTIGDEPGWVVPSFAASAIGAAVVGFTIVILVLTVLRSKVLADPYWLRLQLDVDRQFVGFEGKGQRPIVAATDEAGGELEERRVALYEEHQGSSSATPGDRL